MYHRKLSPQEALNEIKLRMKYDSRKTLTENLNEESPIDDELRKIGDLFYFAAAGAGTVNSDMVQAVQNLTSAKQFWDLDAYLKTKPKGLNFVDTINDEFGVSDWSDVEKIINKLKELGVVASAEKFGTKSMVDNSFKITSVPVTTETPPPAASTSVASGTKSSADNGTSNTKKTNKTSAPVVTIPDDLGGVDGVKAFQDWLDQNKGKWAYSTRSKTNYSVNKDPKMGYGNYGANTQKMWNDPKVKEEYLNSKVQKDKKFAPDVEDDEEMSTTGGF